MDLIAERDLTDGLIQHQVATVLVLFQSLPILFLCSSVISPFSFSSSFEHIPIFESFKHWPLTLNFVPNSVFAVGLLLLLFLWNYLVECHLVWILIFPHDLKLCSFSKNTIEVICLSQGIILEV